MSILTKVFELYDVTADYLADDHVFSISENALNKILKTEECFWSKLKEHGVEEIRVKLQERNLIVLGKFRHNSLFGSFTLTLQLDHIEWKRGHHSLFLRLLHRDIVLEKNAQGAMASAVNAISKGVFNKDLFGEKIDSFFADGVAEINFNKLKPSWDILFSMVDVHFLHAAESSLQIKLKFCLDTIKKRPADLMFLFEAIKDIFEEQKEHYISENDSL